ncbi:c-type cytochrome [Panacibacter ginsenosidivorans]|nr:c-type cytochrome [Panacibacter ginsenosidivorans]
MKNTLISCTVILIMTHIACNNGNPANKKYPDKTSATDSIINSAGNTADAAYRKGARLIAANDCFTCHRIEEKTIGPSYREIAAKYHFNEGNVENLSHSVIHGSKGLWGNKEMTAHPNLKMADAKEMVRYILSLDTTNKNTIVK